MSKARDCSLSDTTELRKIILENPELPLLIFAGENAWSGEYAYESTDVRKIRIEELTLYYEFWLNREDYEEQLANDLSEEEEYKDMPEKEFEQMIAQRVSEAEFVKAIVIHVG